MSPRLFLMLCFLIGPLLGFIRPCQAGISDLTEEGTTSGSVVLKHDLRIPVGARGRTVRHQIFRAGTLVETIPESISRVRSSMGLTSNIEISQQERFFQGFLWEIRKGEDQTTFMPGKITKIFVTKGDSVERGSPLYTIEAMKMECLVMSSKEGMVKRIYGNVGEIIERGAVLLSLLPRSPGWQSLSSEVILANESILLSLFPWGTGSAGEPPSKTPPDNDGGLKLAKRDRDVSREKPIRETFFPLMPFPSLSSGLFRTVSFSPHKEDPEKKGRGTSFIFFPLLRTSFLGECDFPGFPGTSPSPDFLKREGPEIDKRLETQSVSVLKGKKVVLEFIKRGEIASFLPKTSFPAHSLIHAKSPFPIWLGVLFLFLIFQGLAQRTRHGFKESQKLAMKFVQADALIKNGLIPYQTPSNQNFTQQQKRKAS